MKQFRIISLAPSAPPVRRVIPLLRRSDIVAYEKYSRFIQLFVFYMIFDKRVLPYISRFALHLWDNPILLAGWGSVARWLTTSSLRHLLGDLERMYFTSRSGCRIIHENWIPSNANCVRLPKLRNILGVVKRNPLFLHEIEWKNNGFLFITSNIKG